ncbi:MAG: TlyA family RNA methyltransferase [Candidatus Eremiobacteraeota bacterium]|nr:TlyA family RNA methyltransferase [Candidatus Eremiobacteraeota bacterium]
MNSFVAMRLDSALAERMGLTRAQARSLIMEGRVRVNGAPATKAGANVRPDSEIILARPRRFVSRGGEKLEHALAAFRIDVSQASALDVGASTGGFTDCLLQRGAAHVVAVDVGYGQLAWALRNDPRVTVMERTNFRLVKPDAFAKTFDIITIDASFISLRPIVDRARTFLSEAGAIVALVKPQFEAGRERLGRGGVVRDPEVHRAILREVRDTMTGFGLSAIDLVGSPLLGPAGNREFLMLVRRQGETISNERVDDVLAG